MVFSVASLLLGVAVSFTRELVAWRKAGGYLKALSEYVLLVDGCIRIMGLELASFAVHGYLLSSSLAQSPSCP